MPPCQKGPQDNRQIRQGVSGVTGGKADPELQKLQLSNSTLPLQYGQHKQKILDTGFFFPFVTQAAPLTSSSYTYSPVTQPGLAQSLQAFYQLAPPQLGVS